MKAKQTHLRVSGLLALFICAANISYGNANEETVAPDTFPPEETPLLISDDSAPEDEMTGIAHELRNIPDSGGENTGNSHPFSRPEDVPEEEEDISALLEVPKKRTFAPIPIYGLTDWHHFLLGNTRPSRIIILPAAPQENEDEEKNDAGTQNSAENIQLPEDDSAGTLAANYDIAPKALSFRAVTPGTYTSYAVSALAETTGTDSTTIGSGTADENIEKIFTNHSEDNICFYDGFQHDAGRFLFELVSSTYNWCGTWTFGNNTYDPFLGSDNGSEATLFPWHDKYLEEQGVSTADRETYYKDYTNSETADVVVFDTKRNVSTDSAKYTVELKGTLTPKAIYVVDGDYKFVPKSNSVTTGQADGYISGAATLTVCEGASLTLTDDNHYTGDTNIYGTINLDATSVFPDNGTLSTGKLGEGHVYVHETGTLNIGTSHLNNQSLNIEGGKVILGAPYFDSEGNLVAHTLLQDSTGNHAENGAVVRLGENGTGGTLDLTGSWANGHYALYSGVLTSTGGTGTYTDADGTEHTKTSATGHISGKIDIDIAAGDTLEIRDIIFTRDVDEVSAHTHTATIAEGGTLLLSGATDMRLHSLNVTLSKPADGTTKTTAPVLFEKYESTETGTVANLDIATLNITVDEATLSDLIEDSKYDADGGDTGEDPSQRRSKYRVVSIADASGNATDEALGNYVTANFTSVIVNNNTKYEARINDYGELIIFGDGTPIPEPAAFALMVGLVSATLAGTRRRRKRD